MAGASTVSQCIDKVLPVSLGEFQLQVRHPSQYRPGLQVSVDSNAGLVVAVAQDHVHVAFGDYTPAVHQELVQHFQDCTAEDLQQGFFAFWEPWWCRDSVAEAESYELWPAFQAILRRFPRPWPAIDIDMHNLDVWKHVLRKSSAKSATGACGFAVSELKMLPDPAICHLIALCAKAVDLGFPSVFLQGRVNVLAKNPDPFGYGDGRPICILPAIYRLWTSVFCLQLLKAWTPLMPISIMGGLPKRSARDVTYSLQHHIEASFLSNSCLSGFVLDIIKCFDSLPRQPVRVLLCHLGCPENMASAWIAGLNRMTRSATFCGQISAPVGSTTGLPQGDAVSVASCIALCWVLHCALSEFDIAPALYVDNWSWHSDLPDANAVAMQETLHVTEALHLSIDWKKSFAWARDVDSYRWWCQMGPSLLPSHAEFQILSCAKDLGTAMRYRGSTVLGCLHARIQEGHLRLRRLKPQPRPLHNKARMIQSAVWPAIFYGAEGHAIGQKRIAGLRSSAAKALLGASRTPIPFWRSVCCLMLSRTLSSSF